MISSTQQAVFADQLLACGVIKQKKDSPDGRGFRLKLHEEQPDAPLSPIYVDLLVLRSAPEAFATAVALYRSMLAGLRYDAIADVPTAGTPFAGALVLITRRPMITPRPPKTHGTGGEIDGFLEQGRSVVVLDDLITGAHSKLEAIQTLREHGYVVEHVVVLVDREQGGREGLAAKGVTLHAACTLRWLLNHYLDAENITQASYDEITKYLGAS